jgi:excisionase family DNA binding protein
MIDEDKLRQLIADAVREALEQRARDPKPEAVYLSIADAAKVAGCSAQTISRQIHSGQLPAARRGRLVRIARGDLDIWMRTTPVLRKAGVINVMDYARRVRERAEKKK